MTDPLSKLPLFATDKELAVAIVGKGRASMYVNVVIPALERRGFAKIDPLHYGRPLFYCRVPGSKTDGKEDLYDWARSMRRLPTPPTQHSN